MFNLLYKYLVLYNYVNIPGVGHFTIEKQPARLDIDAKIIHAPIFVVKYKHETDSADKAFYNFIAGEMNIDVVDAIRQFQDFAFQLKNNIKSGKVAELPCFGTLKMERDEVKFLPDPVLKEYYPSLNVDDASLSAINDVIVDDEEQMNSVDETAEDYPAKSYWWLYALILAIAGIGAIVYYYYQELN